MVLCADTCQALRGTPSESAPREAEPKGGGTPLNSFSLDIPPELCCPITCGVLRDPVVTCLGHTYERWAILEFWHSSPLPARDPLTNEVLPNPTLTANHSVRRMVSEFLDFHPTYTPSGWPDRTLAPLAGQEGVPRSSQGGRCTFEEQRLAAARAAAVRYSATQLGRHRCSCGCTFPYAMAICLLSLVGAGVYFWVAYGG